MKTPMQELRHEIEVWLDAADDNLVFAYKSVLEAIDESYLKKEKELMCEFAERYLDSIPKEHPSVEDVYNETFNTEEK